MTKPICLTLATTGGGKCCSQAQLLCCVLSITPKLFFAAAGLLLTQGILGLQQSLEAPTQVSQVYCAKNNVYLLLVYHYMNKLLARMGSSPGLGSLWSAAELRHFVSCICGHMVAFFFSLLRPFRTTFLHVAHPFGMRNVYERDVTSVTSWCSQSLFPAHGPVQYNLQKAMSAPCSIPCEAHLRKVKITV